MSDFFVSPKERASQKMYEGALSGDIIGKKLLDASSNEAMRKIIGQASNRLGGISGDVLSRAASQGISPGSSTEALTSMAQEPIMASEQDALSSIQIAKQQQLFDMMIKQLFAGYEGLSSSSSFGDLMSGLGFAAQIVTGIETGFPGTFGGTPKASTPSIEPTTFGTGGGGGFTGFNYSGNSKLKNNQDWSMPFWNPKKVLG